MSDLMRAEWLKLRSLRSTWIIVLLGFVAVVALGIANGVEFGEGPESTSMAERLETATAGAATLSPFVLIIGTLSFTTEFRYGTMSSTLIDSPVRSQVMAAKLLTYGIFAVVVGAVVTGVSAVAALVVLEARDYSVPLMRYDLFRPLVGGVLFLGLCAVVGAAVGVLVRQAAIAVAVVIAWPMVVESTLGALLPDSTAKFLPFDAGERLFSTSPASGDLLDAWVGGAVFATWTALLLAVAFAVFARHDIATAS
jgi:ABC-2 type transport system permease protein